MNHCIPYTWNGYGTIPDLDLKYLLKPSAESDKINKCPDCVDDNVELELDCNILCRPETFRSSVNQTSTYRFDQFCGKGLVHGGVDLLDETKFFEFINSFLPIDPSYLKAGYFQSVKPIHQRFYWGNNHVVWSRVVKCVEIAQKWSRFVKCIYDDNTCTYCPVIPMYICRDINSAGTVTLVVKPAKFDKHILNVKCGVDVLGPIVRTLRQDILDYPTYKGATLMELSKLNSWTLANNVYAAQDSMTLSLNEQRAIKNGFLLAKLLNDFDNSCDLTKGCLVPKWLLDKIYAWKHCHSMAIRKSSVVGINILQTFIASHYNLLETYSFKPKVILLQGKPGVGKTYLSRRIANSVGVGEEDIYMRCEKHKFWEGYNGQKVVVFDDLFQGSQSMVFERIKEFALVCSENLVTVPQARLEDKGMIFVSPYIVITINPRKLNWENNFNLEAFARRIDLTFAMTAQNQLREVGTGKLFRVSHFIRNLLFDTMAGCWAKHIAILSPIQEDQEEVIEDVSFTYCETTTTIDFLTDYDDEFWSKRGMGQEDDTAPPDCESAWNW